MATPIITHDAPVPFSRPDYAGGGIANLMAAIERALGRHPEQVALPSCRLLSEAALREARHVVLLVVDGLGTCQLEAHAAGGALAGARRGDLTSVFPSTTASAVTTFLTGDAPALHGLTGWHMWLREVGEVCAPLPFRMRGTRAPLEAFGFDAGALLGTRPFAARLSRRVRLMHPGYLCDTRFTEAHRGGAQVVGFTGLDEMTARLVAATREREPSYCYVYWPDLDGLSHAHGWQSRQAAEHLVTLDRAVEACARALEGSGSVLLVSADHGFVDTREDTRLRLEDCPDIVRTLDRPLCGEPRLAYCYVRDGAGDDFEQAARELLGHALEVLPAEELLDRGLLGPGPCNPELRHRVGTYALVLHGQYCLSDRVPGEEPFGLVGVHGGMSDAELRVPLCVFGAD